jgi:hypothetical protein
MTGVDIAPIRSEAARSLPISRSKIIRMVTIEWPISVVGPKIGILAPEISVASSETRLGVR